MKVDIYCRVSTEDQNVSQQVAYLKEWCSRQIPIMQINRIISDTESGRLPLTERKKFRKLLESHNGSDAMVVFRLDRLTRNWDDVTLIEREFRENWDTYKLVSAGEPVDLSCATGRLNFRLMMAIHCFMPEDMREKQKVGIERARKQGKYLGRKPGAKNKI